MKTYKWMIALALSLAMFVQGLYFNEQVLAALAVACGALIYIIIKKRQLLIPKDPVLYFLVFYVLSHLVGYITFVEKGMLVFGISRSLLYLLVYVLLYQIYDAEFWQKFKWSYTYVMLIGGLVSAMAFLFGVLESKSYVIEGRLAGPVQYANAMAILLIVALMFFMSFKMRWYFKVLGIIGFIIPTVLTMSRAGIIIGLLVLILYLISNKTPMATYLSFIASIIVSIVMAYAFNASGAVERISGTTLNASEFQTRLLYYTDALTMIKEKLTGYGPYGYYYAQRAFQTGSTYHTKFVHSGILQICLELGVLAGVVTMVFAFYIVFIRKYDWMSRLAVIALIGHSIVDVDLSYAFIWLLLVVLIQQGNVGTCKVYTVKMKSFWMELSMFGGLAVLAVGAIYMMFVTFEYDQKNYEQVLAMYPYHTEAMRKSISQSDDVLVSAQRAMILKERNPYIVEAHEVLYNNYVRMDKIDKALEESRELVRLNGLQITRYETLAKTLRIMGQRRLEVEDVEGALGYFEEILEMPRLLGRLAKEKNTHYNVRHVPYLGMTPTLESEYAITQEWIKKINSESLEAVNE